ncbi:MAG TPA: alginate export family protein [Holophagaceae bacterium]|nr:alginate export family protein [Holophagaceae bacterium]
MPTRITPVLLSLAACAAFAQDAATPVDALKSGKTSLELRTRYEQVDDKGSGKTADALTNRLVLGYKTGEWQGISAFAQFENIAVLGTPARYYVPQTGDGDPSRATVVDPPVTQVNQLYLAWKGLKVGRQAINLDNQRFIGSVAWRQNDQTFTGASFSNATWIPKTEFTLAHLTQVAPITGITKDLRMDLANVRISVIPGGNIRLFRYQVDEVTARPTSLAHTGARLDGEVIGILYDVSYATQRRYKDATAAATPDANYRYASLGYKITADHRVLAAQEEMEPGFRTPYATLHAWDGWADRFLTTPARGLVDRFVQYQGKLGAWNLVASYHAFKAQSDGAAYGRESDLSVEYQATAWLKVMVKGASYAADAETPTLGTPNRDLKKLWIQTAMSF